MDECSTDKSLKALQTWHITTLLHSKTIYLQQVQRQAKQGTIKDSREGHKHSALLAVSAAGWITLFLSGCIDREDET